MWQYQAYLAICLSESHSSQSNTECQKPTALTSTRANAAPIYTPITHLWTTSCRPRRRNTLLKTSRGHKTDIILDDFQPLEASPDEIWWICAVRTADDHLLQHVHLLHRSTKHFPVSGVSLTQKLTTYTALSISLCSKETSGRRRDKFVLWSVC